MAFKVGDRVTMEVRNRGLSLGMGNGPVTQRRAGEIKAVLVKDPPRYEIAWDRGNSSIYSPSVSELRLETEEEASARD